MYSLFCCIDYSSPTSFSLYLVLFSASRVVLAKSFFAILQDSCSTTDYSSSTSFFFYLALFSAALVVLANSFLKVNGFFSGEGNSAFKRISSFSGKISFLKADLIL